jgi:hypothetical protein
VPTSTGFYLIQFELISHHPLPHIRRLLVYIFESHPRIVKSQDTPTLLSSIDLSRNTSILPPLESPSNQTMVQSVKMASIVVAILFWACAQAGSTTEDAMADMVPVSVPVSEHVTVAMLGGGVGTLAARLACLQCKCCNSSNPTQCEDTSCCATFNCDPAGKCTFVKQKCGCGGFCY